jgi:hypothetical protein
MTIGKIALVALALVACASPSNAQRPLIPFPGSQGTPEEQAACRPDARRLCREFVGNDMAVLSCFQQNRAKLSQACRTVLERRGQ